jgi:hypothetical protein
MQVTVQVKADAAKALQQRAGGDPVAGELRKAAGRHGVKLEPLFPGSSDPLLGSFFQVEVPDLHTAQRVIEDLKRIPATEAAYVKPSDEPP